MTEELRFLIRLVKSASKLIGKDIKISPKDDKGDIVTNYDILVEKFITEKLKKAYPDFTIVSEEFNSGKELTKNCFTIDPIDGTINFAHKLKFWAIQIAMNRNGKTVASVIYFPALKELYSADSSGAYLNGEPLHVAGKNAGTFLCAVAGSETIKKLLKYSKGFYRYRNFGCAAYAFALAARGVCDGVMFARDSYWDYVPGIYLVKQAGGKVYDKPEAHIGANNTKTLAFLKKALGEGE